jgi:hypothetical protein
MSQPSCLSQTLGVSAGELDDGFHALTSGNAKNALDNLRIVAVPAHRHVTLPHREAAAVKFRFDGAD